MKKYFLFFLVLITICYISIPSCSRDDYSVNNEKNAQPYLELSSYDIPLYCLSQKDIITFSNALHRFGLYVNDNCLNYTLSSAKEGNMSEELFNLIVSLINQTEKGAIWTRANSPTDCVAQALSLWGGGYNYNTINSYIQSLYGNNGVPTEDILSVVQHFYPSAHFVAIDSINVNNFHPDVQSTIGYFLTESSNVAHMVNIDAIDSLGVTTYYDVQNNVIDVLDVTSYLGIISRY